MYGGVRGRELIALLLDFEQKILIIRTFRQSSVK